MAESSYRIFIGKDEITWQGNTGNSLLSSVRKQPGWSWKCPGRSRMLPASSGLTRRRLVNRARAYRQKHAGDEPPLQLSERARLRELERENRELRMKNDFLSKAAAYFAAEHR